jgi:hypothetical protein
MPLFPIPVAADVKNVPGAVTWGERKQHGALADFKKA